MIVYKHLKPNDEIFYIGIGDHERSFSKSGRNKHWRNTVNKYSYKIEIIHENLSWELACEIEIHLIKFYRRRDKGLGPLVNMTDGGEGNYGRVVSNETRLKHSLSMKNKKLSEEHKRKLSLAKKNKLWSTESKLKKQISMSKHRIEISIKISNSNKKKIIDVTTNIIYDSVKDVCNKFNLSVYTMQKKLSPHCKTHKNNTNFIYYIDDTNK